MNFFMRPEVVDLMIVAGPIFAIIIYGICTGQYPPEEEGKERPDRPARRATPARARPRPIGLHHLHRHRHRLAAADAQRRHPPLAAVTPQRRQQSRH